MIDQALQRNTPMEKVDLPDKHLWELSSLTDTRQLDETMSWVNVIDGTETSHLLKETRPLPSTAVVSRNTNVANTQKDNGTNPKGNEGWVYAVGNAGIIECIENPTPMASMGTFLLNNRYASILFNTGADRSFISTAFSSLINIAPTPLENSYDVELADGKIMGIDTIIRGCTLNLLNHPFNIDLMAVELGSFDVIIDMDC
ncbi:putative reverse transcriptase domain-containing protein [Tanacetum coccineum]